MQCRLMRYSCCCLTPKVFFIGLGLLGLAVGVLSAIWPRRSIGLYQWIMERFNWRVTPIDEAREVRNTVFLGAFLALLSGGMLALSFLRL